MESKIHNYQKEIEEERIREYQKALEREKIAKGIHTKEDEKRLKEMQKMQMEERRMMEREEHDREMMWHRVLLDECYRKEQFEQIEQQRRRQEMLERKLCYDEQITCKNKKRQDMLQMDREKENQILEKMQKKMEHDYFETIKKKKEQQIINRKNFTEGHQMKLLRQNYDKQRAREIDAKTIRVALENLKRDEERKKIQMKNLQLEKKIYVENYNRERGIASALREESEKIADEWQQNEHKRTDERLQKLEQERSANKQKEAEEYKRHIQRRDLETELAKQERITSMQRVRKTAVEELQRSLHEANMEFKRQISYKNSLDRQIRGNQKCLASESNITPEKVNSLTKNADMYKDVIKKQLKTSSGRTSTNPVHPFKRIMESREKERGNNSIHLPSIG